MLFPSSHDDVVALVRIALEHCIALTLRGAGSGNVGGALPAPGSAVVSFECMRRVLEFDPDNRLIVVEPGVVTEDIDRIARSAGLFYPPTPQHAFPLRRNLAMNAAGPRAVKYGVTRDYVLGLRAVTGSDRKSAPPPHHQGRHRLRPDPPAVVSGGTLALITEATLKLLPRTGTIATLRACFANNRAALDAVSRVMHQAVMPCALEFMDHHAIDAIRPTGAADDLPPGTRALLMVEADGAAQDLPRQIAALEQTLAGEGLLGMRSGFKRDDIARLWAARKSLSHAVKRIAPLKINEDVVVPVSQLADFVDFIDHTAQAQRLPIVSFGHAGNGNLHVNLMVHPDDADEMRRAHLALEAIMLRALALGGTLSGEHGIGTEKRRFIAQEIDPVTLDLMRAIKQQFDPHGLLNPGKLFPD